MVEQIETDVDRLLWVLTMKTNFPICFAKIELFINFEIKSNLSTRVFVFSTLSQIFNTKFDVFLIKTCRNWTKLFTYKLAIPSSSITCP